MQGNEKQVFYTISDFFTLIQQSSFIIYTGRVSKNCSMYTMEISIDGGTRSVLDNQGDNLGRCYF